MKQRQILISFVFTLCVATGNFLPAMGQKVLDAVSFSVNLDHADWVYITGEKAIFSISLSKGGSPVKDVTIHYQIGPERMPPNLSQDIRLHQTIQTIDGGTMTEPGFLRCIATVNVDGKPYRALATAAFSPERIQAYAKMPADFMDFWRQQRKAQQKIPMDVRQKLLPERCDSLINVYEVSVQNNRPGSRIYGILSVPKKEGKYPAVLKVPGAGVRPYRGDTALAQKGVITLEIGIHGVTVTQPYQFYYDLAFGALHNYFFMNLDNRDTYYYNRVYLGCLRAVDLLASLPQTDTSRLAVYGGSQGGALALVTTALDPRIKYVGAFYFAMSDLTGYLHGRAGGWPHMFSPAKITEFGSQEKRQVSAYYDVANFARYITVPGIYCWGYNDEVCPPTTSYASYNNIAAPKTLVIAKEAGHWLMPAQAIRVADWLLWKLKVE